jgi:hypothetical protein
MGDFKLRAYAVLMFRGLQLPILSKVSTIQDDRTHP